MKIFRNSVVLPLLLISCAAHSSTNLIKVTSVEASDDDGNIAENTLDRSLETRWSAAGEQWLEYDLGHLTKISEINISFAQGDKRQTLFSLDLSTDGVNWVTVFYGRSVGGTSLMEKYRFPEMKARYVRFNGRGNTTNVWNSVTQIELAGSEQTSQRESSLFTQGPIVDTSPALAQEAIHADSITYVYPDSYAAPSDEDIVWQAEFLNQEWQNDPSWTLMNSRNFGIVENTEVLSDGERNYLRVHYPKGSINSGSVERSGTPLGGAQFYTKPGFIEAGDDLELSYYVRFSSNFDFVKGGKLPGLYGGDGSASGGNIPESDQAFSSRYMWRTNGDGEVYAYIPSSANHGSSIGRGNWSFEPDRWYHLVQRIRLNEPGNDNGFIVVYVDGSKVLEEQNIVFRVGEQLTVDGLFFSTFFGGSDESWGTPQDVYTDFASFQIAR